MREREQVMVNTRTGLVTDCHRIRELEAKVRELEAALATNLTEISRKLVEQEPEHE